MVLRNVYRCSFIHYFFFFWPSVHTTALYLAAAWCGLMECDPRWLTEKSTWQVSQPLSFKTLLKKCEIFSVGWNLCAYSSSSPFQGDKVQTSCWAVPETAHDKKELSWIGKNTEEMWPWESLERAMKNGGLPGKSGWLARINLDSRLYSSCLWWHTYKMWNNSPKIHLVTCFGRCLRAFGRLTRGTFQKQLF